MINRVLFLAIGISILLQARSQSPNYSAEEIEVSVKGVSLFGTLVIPNGVKKPPVVLIIAGSGPTDRNGNSPIIKGKNNSLLQLADSLARHGIASLRYDKRAIGKSVVKNFAEDSMRFSDGVDDAAAFCKFLKTRKFKKIFIAGHSEGSLVGLATAHAFPVSGYFSIAGAGRRIDEVLKEQLLTLPDSLRMLSYRYLDSLAAGKKISKPHPFLLNIFRPSVQPYMISWIQYDPQQLIHTLSCPALIVQGTHDLQVKVKDAESLAAANPAARLLIIQHMNHVLKNVSSDSKEDNIKAYSDPSLPLMQELITGMVTFILSKHK
ncbi:MAG: alpha/beta hydrolase [Bacteroidetes bacterium]|nr:alpha/beta hydrolase [Bacteroidota bacterium]